MFGKFIVYILALVVIAALALSAEEFIRNQRDIITSGKFSNRVGYRKLRVFNVDDYFNKPYIELSRMKKPIMFVHIPLEYNSTECQDMNAYGLDDPNHHICNPILELSIESIIRQYGNVYDVVLFDNTNVADMCGEHVINDVPSAEPKYRDLAGRITTSHYKQTSTSEDLCNISNPSSLKGHMKFYWESYVASKLIHTFGGVYMKPYFMFSKPYELRNHLYASGDLTSINIMSYSDGMYDGPMVVKYPDPSVFLMGKRNSAKAFDMMSYFEKKYHNAGFEGSFDAPNSDKELKTYISECLPEDVFGQVVHETVMGKEYKEKMLTIYDLMDNNKFIQFAPKNNALFVNVPILNQMNAYKWVFNVSKQEVVESNTLIGRYLMNHCGMEKRVVNGM